jgi:hypothetical protein
LWLGASHQTTTTYLLVFPDRYLVLMQIEDRLVLLG